MGSYISYHEERFSFCRIPFSCNRRNVKALLLFALTCQVASQGISNKYALCSHKDECKAHKQKKKDFHDRLMIANLHKVEILHLKLWASSRNEPFSQHEKKFWLTLVMSQRAFTFCVLARKFDWRTFWRFLWWYQRRRNTGYKNPKLVAKHCCVSSFWSMFLAFHLAGSICRATKTFVAGWRNAARWLVDLLSVDPRWRHHNKFVAWQVESLMKNEQQSHNLLLKVDPGSTLSNNFLQPATNVFVARQVDYAGWKTRNINQKLETQQCCATSLGFLYPVFRRLKAAVIILMGYHHRTLQAGDDFYCRSWARSSIDFESISIDI